MAISEDLSTEKTELQCQAEKCCSVVLTVILDGRYHFEVVSGAGDHSHLLDYF